MRTLTRSEHAQALAACRGSTAEQRAFAKRFAPEVFDAWKGWTWDRWAFDLKIGKPDPVPNSARFVMSLEVTEYIARKKDPDGKARRIVYEHDHDRPYAQVVTTADGAPGGPKISTLRRGVPTFRGPALFVLGELRSFGGTDPEGRRIYWRAPAGMLLAGCPVTHDLHVIRSGPAARAAAPVWILRNRSPYRLTDAGITR